MNKNRATARNHDRCSSVNLDDSLAKQ
uniref:Uncharacterized protein n=1 Tax=Rhizophora mucronata TaxID=61149 RepID=A0A2P2PA96_RHIMU